MKSLSKSLFKMSKKIAKSAVKDVKRDIKKSLKTSAKSANSKPNHKESRISNDVPEWQVYKDKNGFPTDFYKDGKHWLYGDKEYMCISPSGKYYLYYNASYGDYASECIALTTESEGLIRKSGEFYVESALVTDKGIGYLYTEEGDIHILTANGKSKKHLCDDPEAYILVPQGCFVAVTSDSSKLEDHEQIIVKGFLFDSEKSWKRAIDYEIPDDYVEITLKVSESIISVTMPDGNVANLDISGRLL